MPFQSASMECQYRTVTCSGCQITRGNIKGIINVQYLRNGDLPPLISTLSAFEMLKYFDQTEVTRIVCL